MSWIRSSKSAALVVLLVGSLAVVGPAAALTVTAENVPTETEVGEEVTVTIVIEDPFEDRDTWTLNGETELENVSWELRVLDQGDQVGDGFVSGEQTFERELDKSNGGDEVRIELTGTTPAVDNYTYESRETYTLFRLSRITGSNEQLIRENETHHYTNDSKAAREQIDAAQDAINESGGNSEAEEQLNRAIEAYNGENFDNAISLAEDAESKAESAQQSQQTMQTALIAVGAILVLLLVGGGVYYWQSGGDDYDKLQ